MDAYLLQQEIFRAWQKLAASSDAGSVNKTWSEVGVFVDGKQVTGIKIINNKIELETK